MLTRRTFFARCASLTCLLLAETAYPAQVEPLQLRLKDGTVLQGEIRLPEHSPPPHPAILLFGGIRVASTVLDTLPDDFPIAAASFSYPYSPPQEIGVAGSAQALREFEHGVARTFEGIELLVALLRRREDIDPCRLTLVGASLGAPFAVIAGQRHFLPGVVVIHGFGDLPGMIGHQFTRALSRRYGDWIGLPSHVVANLLVWLTGLPAPEAYAERLQAGQRTLMIVADEDELVPPRSTEVLWRAMRRSGADVERIDESGEHLHGAQDPRLGGLTLQVLAWMQRHGLS